MAHRRLNDPRDGNTAEERVARALQEFFETHTPEEVVDAAKRSSPELYKDGKLIEVSPQQMVSEEMRRWAEQTVTGIAEAQTHERPSQASRKPSQR